MWHRSFNYHGRKSKTDSIMEFKCKYHFSRIYRCVKSGYFLQEQLKLWILFISGLRVNGTIYTSIYYRKKCLIHIIPIQISLKYIYPYFSLRLLLSDTKNWHLKCQYSIDNVTWLSFSIFEVNIMAPSTPIVFEIVEIIEDDQPIIMHEKDIC